MKGDTKRLLSQITNPKLMLSKAGVISAYNLKPITEGVLPIKKTMFISPDKELPSLMKRTEMPISIFEEKTPLKSRNKHHKTDINNSLSKVKESKSRNVSDTSDYFFFPTDNYKYPSNTAYYSYATKHHTSRVPKEENSYHYYIDHDTNPLYKIHGIVEFSKMASERKPFYLDKSQSYRKDYQTIDVVKNDADNNNNTISNNNTKPTAHRSILINKSNHNDKTVLPRTLEYNPRYDFVHPRLKTFVNYSPQKPEVSKSMKDQSLPYDLIKSYNTQHSNNNNNKAYHFDQMKGRIKDGIQQKYPSYMYCLYNKFGLEQPNDVALKMNNYTNHTQGINTILTQSHNKKDTQANDNDLLKRSIHFMRKNRKIYNHLKKNETYFSMKY